MLAEMKQPIMTTKLAAATMPKTSVADERLPPRGLMRWATSWTWSSNMAAISMAREPVTSSTMSRAGVCMLNWAAAETGGADGRATGRGGGAAAAKGAGT